MVPTGINKDKIWCPHKYYKSEHFDDVMGAGQ